MIDNSYNGALVYLQESTAVYAKANKIFTHITATGFNDIIGVSQSIKSVIADAKSFAKSSSTVMINGESGTGKEILASAIHCESKHAKGPFVAVNCAGIPDNLLESELFGYVEGAFTGARKGGKIGKFELADGGTLFLDEIGELPIHLQPKLLRILQEMSVQRIGSNISKKINVRVIAATNRNLEEMIYNKEFREDLFYRLNVIPIVIPPLRDRKSDIDPLNDYFLEMYSSMLNKDIDCLDEDARKRMFDYNWPGNVRELQNTIEYAVNKTDSTTIRVNDLPKKLTDISTSAVKDYIPVRLSDIEKDAIINSLKHNKNSKNTKDIVARDLGISRATLYRRIKELNIDI